MSDIQKAVHPTLHGTTQVAAHIRQLILSRSLRPRERLVQSELAEQLGVSRTPIREALHKLETDGLVTISPHKGATVADFSLSELEDIESTKDLDPEKALLGSTVEQVVLRATQPVASVSRPDKVTDI